MEPGAFVKGKMVALLRALGADYVLDTNFAADLTIVEEASELIRRITEKDRPRPSSPAAAPAGYTLPRCMPPSCCPIYPPQRAPSACRAPR